MATTTPGRLTEIVPETVTLAQWLQRSEQSEVPDLQRRLAWIAEHIDELMADIDAYANDPRGPPARFIGSFLVQPGSDDGEIPRHTLVDGQQRTVVTEVMVAIIAAMYEDEFGDTAAAEFLRDEYLSIATRSGRKPKVVLTELDDDAFQAILEDPSTTTSHESMNKLNAAIQAEFDERVETHDDLVELEELILDRQAIVVINLGDRYSPYRIFEERNGRGSALTPVDRVKNRILEVADGDPSVDMDDVKEEWWRMRRALEGHNETRALRYITMAGNLVPVSRKVSGGDLYPTIKDIVDDRLDDEGIALEEYVSWLANAAETYSAVATPSYRHSSASADQHMEINRHLENLNTIGAKPARILVLGAIFRDIGASELVDILVQAEKFSFVRRTVERRIPQEIQAYLRIIHGKASAGISPAFSTSNPVDAVRDELQNDMPSRTEFEREFERASWTTGAKTVYALTVLEHEHFLDPVDRHGGFGGPLGRAQVEHVIPRRYNAKKYRNWHSYLSASKEDLELDVDRIGNLTLLEDRKNIKASADPFEQKRDPHYVSSDYAMANELADNYSSWGLDEVRVRSEDLAEIAADIWTL